MTTTTDRTPERAKKSAPGEWTCGRYVAFYDEHLRAYFVYDEADTTQSVTMVRRLRDFEAFVASSREQAA